MREDSGNRTVMVAIITILSVFLIAIIGFIAYFAISGNSENKANKKTNPPVINITSCPQQVTSDDPNVTVEGILLSDAPFCNLSINGEVVATTTSQEVQKKWSKTYTLSPGETKQLTIEAKDSNDVVTEEQRSVYCQQLNKKKKLAPITPGCTLVKKKSGGLNIRAYAGTSYMVVDFIDRNDYTSEMTFTGHYKVDYQGYTWYEIISPRGKHGYVRSDLVKSNTYVD